MSRFLNGANATAGSIRSRMELSGRMAGHAARVEPRLGIWFLVPVTAAIGIAGVLWPNTVTFGVAAVAGLWAAVRWPYLFVVLTFWTIVAPTVYVFEVGSFGIAPYVLFEALAAVGVTFCWLTGRLELAAPPGLGFFLLHMAATSVSVFLATDVVAASSLLARLLLSWLMVFLLLAVVWERRRLRNVLAVLLFQAIVVVGVSVVSSLSNLDLPSFPSLLFLHFQKNDYATFLSFALAMASVALMAKDTGVVGTLGGVLLVTLVSVSWPLTYSRSGVLSLLATCLAFMAFYRTVRLLRVAALTAVVAVGVWIVLPSEVKALSARAIESLFSPRGQQHDSFVDTYEDRATLNWAALESIRQRPLVGIGLGEWTARSPVRVSIWDLKRGSVVDVGANIHNRYLLIATESGIPALAAYVAFLVLLLRSANRERRRADAWMRLLLTALMASTIGFLVSNLFIPGSLWEWNLLALLALAVNIARSEANVERVVAYRRPLLGHAVSRRA